VLPLIAPVLLGQNYIISYLFVLRPVFPLLSLSRFPSLLVSCTLSHIFPLRYTSSFVTQVGVSAHERVLIQVHIYILIDINIRIHIHKHNQMAKDDA